MKNMELGISQSRGYEGADLIKVTTNEEGQQLVSGRELYEVLKVQQDYSDWIKKQLGNVDAVENDDFTLLKGKTSKSGGRPGVEYILTVDIAKEICMCVGVAPRTNEETRRLSKQVRKYFIECEKVAKQQIQTQIPNSPMDILKVMFSALEEQKQDIVEVKQDVQNFKEEMPIFTSQRKEISKRVRALGVDLLGGKRSTAYQDKSLRNRLYSDIYGQIHREFGVGSCDDIKRRDYSAVFSVIQSYSVPLHLANDINYANNQMNLAI